jgi:outer membrane protein assembly factor BamB
MWKTAVMGCVAMMAVTGTLRAGDWPNYRGSNLDGVSDETQWKTTWPQQGPKVLWEASVGTGFSAIAVADGRVYTMGNINNRDVVTCLDAETGKEIWKQSYAEPLMGQNYEGGPNATPTVVNGRVYTCSKTAKVHCLDAVSGRIIWAQDLCGRYGIAKPTWGHAGSPVVRDGLVFLNVGTTGLALKAEDGNLAWQTGTGPGGYASPVPYTKDGKSYMIVFGADKIAGVESATGRVVWHKEWKTSYDINAANPIVFGDRIFISSGYNHGCALLRVTDNGVEEVYSNKNMKSQCYGGSLYQGHVYAIDGQVGGGGQLRCLDVETGKVNWTQRSSNLGTGTVTVAGDKLIILGEYGMLFIAEATPEAYKELASARILNNKCWTVPTLSHGLLYARDAQGHMVSLDLRLP